MVCVIALPSPNHGCALTVRTKLPVPKRAAAHGLILLSVDPGVGKTTWPAACPSVASALRHQDHFIQSILMRWPMPRLGTRQKAVTSCLNRPCPEAVWAAPPSSSSTKSKPLASDRQKLSLEAQPQPLDVHPRDRCCSAGMDATREHKNVPADRHQYFPKALDRAVISPPD